MDIVLLYVCMVYLFLFGVSIVGAFDLAFCANFVQRAGLAGLGIWAIWRVSLIWGNGWVYPHEFVIASSMGLYALGTIQKTIHFKRAEHERHCDHRRPLKH